MTNHHILVGEVVTGYPPSSNKNVGKKRWEYVVKAYTPNGGTQMFHRCVMLESFSGVLDYTQRVLPCSGDSTLDAFHVAPSPESTATTVGSRVVLGFPAGDGRYPLILGLLPHEATPVVVDVDKDLPGREVKLSEEKINPSYKSRFNGMEFEINSIGEFNLSHYGFPFVESKPFVTLDVKEPSENYTTQISIQEKGEFSLSNAAGQMFLVDSDLKIISLTDGENEIILNQTDKTMSVTCSGNSDEVIGGNRYRYVELIETIDIKGDQVVSIDGMFQREIKKTYTDKITGDTKVTLEGMLALDVTKAVTVKLADKFNWTSKDIIFKTGKLDLTTTADAKFTIGGKYTLITDADTTLTIGGKFALTSDDITLDAGGAKLHLKSGKVALGGAAAEIFDILIKALDQFITNAATIVATSVGPGVLNPGVVAQLTTFKASLSSVKGSL